MTILVSEIEAERGLRLLCRVGQVSRWLPAYCVPGVVGECDIPVTLTDEDAADLMAEYEERCGVLEFDANMSRSESEAMAKQMVGL